VGLVLEINELFRDRKHFKGYTMKKKIVKIADKPVKIFYYLKI